MPAKHTQKNPLLIKSNDYNYESTKPWANLISLQKKIKDSVHKSIWLTKTEISIIDSEQFQRLRYIRQTGPAYLVYPTAQHTRFDHSLGTLHVAQKMVDSINKSQPGDLCERDIFIVRLVALLHDIAHLPFGHTIEDEGHLFPRKQWLSKTRQKILFQPLAKIIKHNIIQAFERCNRKEGKSEAENVRKQILQTLIAEEDGNVKNLDSPYIADIVGNTICADLLDYVKRDLFFCGLSGGYDESIFFYMTLQRYGEGKEEKKKSYKSNYENISLTKISWLRFIYGIYHLLCYM